MLDTADEIAISAKHNIPLFAFLLVSREVRPLQYREAWHKASIAGGSATISPMIATRTSIRIFGAILGTGEQGLMI